MPPAIAHVVANDDGSYRPFDHRILTKIALMDAHRVGSGRKIEQIMSENEARAQDNAAKRRREEVKDRAKDDWRHIMGHPLVNVPCDLKKKADGS